MESFNWNLLFGIVAVLAVVGISYFFRDRPRCPECQSDRCNDCQATWMATVAESK